MGELLVPCLAMIGLSVAGRVVLAGGRWLFELPVALLSHLLLAFAVQAEPGEDVRVALINILPFYMCSVYLCRLTSKLPVTFPWVRLPLDGRFWLNTTLVLAVLATTVCTVYLNTRVPTVLVTVGLIVCVAATDTIPDAGHHVLFLMDSCVALYCLWLASGVPERQLGELWVLSWEGTVLMEKAVSLAKEEGEQEEHEHGH